MRSSERLLFLILLIGGASANAHLDIDSDNSLQLPVAPRASDKAESHKMVGIEKLVLKKVKAMSSSRSLASRESPPLENRIDESQSQKLEITKVHEHEEGKKDPSLNAEASKPLSKAVFKSLQPAESKPHNKAVVAVNELEKNEIKNTDEKSIEKSIENTNGNEHVNANKNTNENLNKIAEESKDKKEPSVAHEEGRVVPAEQALTWLKNGNTRFLKGYFRKDGVDGSVRRGLSSAQHPHSIVLSCSDSRVPPEVVFDQKLGEIFTVRTAGETLDSSVIASIEYAVSHLGPQVIVVMGHTECGAVKAALSTMKGEDAGSENLNRMVADIHPRLASLNRAPASANFVSESWANARGVVEDLSNRSKIIREKIESGNLKIVPALYHLDSGQVEW